MDINNFKSCIDHEEATIRSFIRDPEYASYLLTEVKQDGDKEEVAYFQNLYDEAKRRAYWDKLAENVKTAIQNGYNLQLILSKLNEATGIVKAAMA